jgi:aryl-alcohol dehydrogenase-like predicted oxidoreductase
MKTRRNFLITGSLAALGSTVSFTAISKEKPKEITVAPEWRNQQSDMSYRMLGRTGLMISEVVNGGDPVSTKNTRPAEVAMERGLNYLDMAPAYGNGECEKGYAKIIDSSSKREKVFMTTKISGVMGVRNRKYKEIFDGLPQGKRDIIMNRVKEMREERGVDIPGYYLTYWPGQERSMDGTYLSNAMAQDYAHQVDASKGFKDFIRKSLEGSLERTGQKYFDILMCPHGADSPEEVQVPEIFETIEELKKEGLIRFLGVSTHNDPAGVLKAATKTGKYDLVMCAYNVINGGYMHDAIIEAKAAGLGIIAMKVAMPVATQHEKMKPLPQWRIDKLNRIVPGDIKVPVKAYLWALQNPNISGVISNLWDAGIVSDNLSITGKKIQLMPA